MHRALFTWFILLIFVVFLLLRLEGRINWNWFFIFFPVWLYDLVLFIDAIATFAMHCKHESFKRIISKKDNYVIFIVLLKVAAQILICLKLEYTSWDLSLIHVLLPLWLLLPILICNVTVTLYHKSSQSYN